MLNTLDHSVGSHNDGAILVYGWRYGTNGVAIRFSCGSLFPEGDRYWSPTETHPMYPGCESVSDVINYLYKVETVRPVNYAPAS